MAFDFGAAVDEITESGLAQIEGFTLLIGAENPAPTGFIPKELLPSDEIQLRYFINNGFVLSAADSPVTGILGTLGFLGFTATSGLTDLTKVIKNNFIVQIANSTLVLNEEITSKADKEGAFSKELELSNFVYTVGAVTTSPIKEEDLLVKPSESGEFFTGERFNPDIKDNRFERVVPTQDRPEGAPEGTDTASKKIAITGGAETLYVSYIAVQEHLLRQEVEIESILTSIGEIFSGKFFATFTSIVEQNIKVKNYTFEEITGSNGEVFKQWILTETFGITTPDIKALDERKIDGLTAEESARLEKENDDLYYAYDVSSGTNILKPLAERTAFPAEIARQLSSGKEFTPKDSETKTPPESLEFKLFNGPGGKPVDSIDSTNNITTIFVGSTEDEALYQAFYQSPNYGLSLSETGRLLVERFDTNIIPTLTNFAILAARTREVAPFVTGLHWPALKETHLTSSETIGVVKTINDSKTISDLDKSTTAERRLAVGPEGLAGNIRGERFGRAVIVGETEELTGAVIKTSEEGEDKLTIEFPTLTDEECVTSFLLSHNKNSAVTTEIVGKQKGADDGEALSFIYRDIQPDEDTEIHLGCFDQDIVAVRGDATYSVSDIKKVNRNKLLSLEGVLKDSTAAEITSVIKMKDAAMVRDGNGVTHIYYIDVKGALNCVVSPDETETTWQTYNDLFDRIDDPPANISKLNAFIDEFRSEILVFFSYKSKLLLKRIPFSFLQEERAEAIKAIRELESIMVLGDKNDPGIAEDIKRTVKKDDGTTEEKGQIVISPNFDEDQVDFTGQSYTVVHDVAGHSFLFYNDEDHIRVRVSADLGEEWFSVFSDDFFIHTGAKKSGGGDERDGTYMHGVYNYPLDCIHLFYIRNRAMYMKNIPVFLLDITEEEREDTEEEMDKIPSILIYGDVKDPNISKEFVKTEDNVTTGTVIPSEPLNEQDTDSNDNVVSQKFTGFYNSNDRIRIFYRIAENTNIIRSSSLDIASEFSLNVLSERIALDPDG